MSMRIQISRPSTGMPQALAASPAYRDRVQDMPAIAAGHNTSNFFRETLVVF
jgi:hypothetical protein